MKRIIIVVLSLAIILGFLFWKFGPLLFEPKKDNGPITLTYWGLWEDDNLIKPILDEYHKINPKVTVNYVRQSSINYRTRVQTQIRAGQGPDVFRIHNSWLPMFTADLIEAPADTFTLTDYKSLFYPIAEASFVKDGKIYAAPMEVDGLGLFINEEMLNGVGGKIPRTWQEFIDTATKMTVKDSTGIKSAGAAIGSTGNVDFWSDILALFLFQQPGVDFNNLATDKTAEVFSFYTDFVTNPATKTWDVNLPPSTQMFIEGRLGFYLAPSWKAHDLRIANPNLKFKVVPVPQLSSVTTGYGTFWGEAVSKNSKNTEEAWKFVKFLTSPQTEKLAYQTASQVRLFGKPYSLVSLASEISTDPIVGAFVLQGPSYKSWYLSSHTFDQGINDEMIKYFEDGINATLQGTDPFSALQVVDRGAKQVIDKYTKPQVVASPK